jgi:protoporphyrinogen oxidase
MQRRTAIIIGAGPAGLTAAYELIARAGVQPIVLEMSEYMGGLARTINYKGNRIDIGGHRFFSKSDRVMEWWFSFLPLQSLGDTGARIKYQGGQRSVAGAAAAPDPERENRVMLLRNRLSRILFTGRFFSYPITLSVDTVRKLGVFKTILIGFSYLRSLAFPIRPEKSLEDFFINRFGRWLYYMFFKTYTEKVWGVPCSQISAEWGAQRIKGLSIYKALLHILKTALRPWRSDIFQKDSETSLIESFLYPKFGPGQMWEEVALRVSAGGGQILTGFRVDRIEHRDHRTVTAIWATHTETGERRRFGGDYFFSSMPVRELTAALDPEPPAPIREIAAGLIYRDFITVGVLCRRLSVREKLEGGRIKDNWIYIQEPDVLVGRLQIFNNWSPYMVSDPDTVWIGLEYFCYEGDDLWRKTDSELAALAKDELQQLKFVGPEDVLDSTVIRMPKAYPAYFGSYDRFGEISAYTDGFDNLFLVGRNGMHRYNNQDHSMLAAMTAVDNIIDGVRSRENLWALNTEMDYHEEKRKPESPHSAPPAGAV